MSVPGPEGSAPRCVICGKPQVARFRPFCSKRCANIDLNRWLKGAYAVPGRPEDEEEGGALPPTSAKG
ncbi:MAG: DNA gyrase inhibitor YacG [Alphaproteobacteria bacterium]|nr:DNA gyrase inhibitor YacG [Alphaproteobacteria bacterium]MDE2012088.1 DNA gyrase inhibitor YacG [Alphaproteobacteria bacterium]MDE2073385.1 DNA gyrase inhibitor YacG [Alphaproteobacteria bacterium]MDE2352217.1 DNA gyrase inhibitor YacG [Alphaproteobacteria bacterium]